MLEHQMTPVYEEWLHWQLIQDIDDISYFFLLLLLHLSSLFKKSRKQYNLVSQIEMIMK